ncbi:MAG: ABC transporter ATP-binding protein [Planctomycetes bacterium]|nr:ABC transporter ATP-binding protein [Planctomycetota bacterium]
MSAPGDTIVRAEGVKRRFVIGGEEVWALKGVDLAVQRGEFLSLMGPSGSGKSTLFNQLGALDRPTSGRVWFEGHSLFELPEAQQAWVRNRWIGYIFQTFNLIPIMSAVQNVMLPVTLAGASKADAHAKAAAMLERVGLGHRLDHKPGELSGGQQQRVAVARALVNQPTVVLADEPTGNLDTATGASIIALLQELNKALGVTVICVTHDHKMLKASDRICYLRDGEIERVATWTELQGDLAH